ncbi:MAG: nucleotide exchange factor GrpE [Clostridia bacterium]|nr:nucleotide exchange factor GrpE [Clostridia bacterium]
MAKNEEKKVEVTESELEKALKEENESLIKELEEEKKKAEDFKDKWMRNVAEFDNYKKRNARLWQDAFDEGKKDVLVKLLPIGDHLDMALNMDLDEKTAEGIKLLVKKYKEILKSVDVEEINPVGEVFDPNIAEAIMQVEASETDESDTVKQVFQKGYKCKDKIIRYAKVSVVK